MSSPTPGLKRCESSLSCTLRSGPMALSPIDLPGAGTDWEWVDFLSSGADGCDILGVAHAPFLSCALSFLLSSHVDEFRACEIAVYIIAFLCQTHSLHMHCHTNTPILITWIKRRETTLYIFVFQWLSYCYVYRDWISLFCKLTNKYRLSLKGQI